MNNQTTRPAPAAARPKGAINWFRFWMQMLAAAIAFNVVAVLLTVYVIWPWLHPEK